MRAFDEYGLSDDGLALKILAQVFHLCEGLPIRIFVESTEVRSDQQSLFKFQLLHQIQDVAVLFFGSRTQLTHVT